MFLKFLNNLNLDEQRIEKYGCCVICIWVKEESTKQIECEDYFTCGSESKNEEVMVTLLIAIKKEKKIL